MQRSDAMKDVAMHELVC